MKRIHILVCGIALASATLPLPVMATHDEVIVENSLPEQAPVDDALTEDFLSSTDEDQAASDGDQEAEIKKLMDALMAHVEKMKQDPKVQELEKELETIGVELTQLSTELEALKKTKESYKSEIKELRGKIAELEKQAGAEQELDSARTLLEEKRVQKRTVKAQIKGHEEKVSGLEKERDGKAAAPEFDLQSLFDDESMKDMFDFNGLEEPAATESEKEQADEFADADGVVQDTSIEAEMPIEEETAKAEESASPEA